MRLALAFSLFVLTAVFAGCSPIPVPTNDPTARTPAPGNSAPGIFPPQILNLATPTPRPRVLRVNLGAHPDLLDPQKASTNGEVAVLQLAYEGLTRLDEKGRVLPGAAERWEYSSDGKSLTFYLRQGLKRADGTPITAADFEFAFKHAVDPRMGATDASFLDDVRGALAAYSIDPKSKPEDIAKALDNVGIKATDDTTLVVSFDQPTGFWPTIAATWVGWPSDKAKVESDPDAWWLKPENHNGNGPFRISEIGEQAIKLVPNPNYWGASAELERIEFYFVAEPAAALEAYRKGELDVVRVPMETFALVQSDQALAKELVRTPAAWVTYLGLNVKKPPFSDKYVRIAFSQAIDREGLVRDMLGGLGKPHRTWIPPGVPGYDDTAVLPAFDPQAAIKTLIDGGYGTPDKKRVDCNKLGSIKLSYSNTPRNQVLFQYLAGNLTRVFACPVLLDPIDAGTYAHMIKDTRTAPQIYLLTWQQEYSHPQDWLFLQTCTGVYASRIGYCSKEFDAAFGAANQELDFDKSIAKYQTAQKLFTADLAALFLWHNENAFLIKPHVRGLREHLGTGDNAWPGQFGPITTYQVN